MAEVRVVAVGRQRRTRAADGAPAPIDTWPPAWRALATRWAQRGPRCKWDTLLASGGSAGFETAHDLLEALLAGGWICVEEAWRNGRWQALWVDFVALPMLRRALGLPDGDTLKAAVATRLAALLEDSAAASFREAAMVAAELRPALALPRLELLAALACWQAPAQATRRDFAQAARGDTKGITAAEWDWLDEHIDLAACGIGEHAPLLCLAAPLALQLPRGVLELGAAPDFLALPPTTFAAATAAHGEIAVWTLVENRTSFERVSRARAAAEGVIWLPGFPPGWWLSSVARLLRLAPAPARIACDPDPAGIEIALAAAELWRAAELAWHPWHMDPADLNSLAHRKPLTDHDRSRLLALRDRALPPALRALSEVLASAGEKGEQEGYL